MKNQHAEFLKVWADDWRSVQFSTEPGKWATSRHVSIFGYTDVEFRHTPKPEYIYIYAPPMSLTSKPYNFFCRNNADTNIRITYLDGKPVAVEMITAGDGK